MQFFRSLICLLLMLAIPASSLHGYADFSTCSHEWMSRDYWADNLHLLTYDEILDLLDEIESGKLEKRCSFVEWEKINQFLFTLANEGLLAQGVEVDTAEYEQIYALANDQSFVISHAVYYGDGDMFYSKTSWSSGWQNTKDFCKKHKKAIIIGVVVVVAVVAVVTIAVIASSAAAGAATAAAVASATANEPYIQNPPPLEKPQEIAELEVLSRPIEINQPSAIKEIIYEHLEPIKDLAQKNVNSSSFREKAREFGSYLTHEALHGVSELTSVLPELQQELNDLSERFLPQGVVPEESKHPKDNFDKWIAQGHEKIDQAFSTDHADYYTTGARSERDSECTMGMLPPPGKLFKPSSKELKRKLDAGKAIDRAGYSKAGRGSMKHGSREETVFPQARGTPEQINEHGQKILEEILSDPKAKSYANRFGGEDIFASSGRGVRFDSDDNFIGFLQPPR
jgi:hypothetical protein